MNQIIRDVAVPNDWDRSGLPGWCYHSEALLDLEKTDVFLTHWQIAAHVNDLLEPGSYLTFDIVGERALLVRDGDMKLHAFHNICRHRGSRLVADERGKCRNALVCPFHGWVYNLDGTLRGAARPDTFPPLDKVEYGLPPIEMEVWQGFIFVRFRPGPQPPVAVLMAPMEAEFSHYRAEQFVPTLGIWTQEAEVNWKSVRDVDNEGYHVAMAHPALQDLYGSTYYDEPFVDGVSRSFATFNPHAGRRWSVREYVKICEPASYLPKELQKAWIYYGVFPNGVLSITPETIQFYQEFPITVNKSLLRGAVYRLPGETRRQRLSRYLACRIDRDTMAEDVQLMEWSNEAMRSRGFNGFFLSDLEYGVRTHHDHLRKLLPVMNLETKPEEAEMASVNASMLSSP